MTGKEHYDQWFQNGLLNTNPGLGRRGELVKLLGVASLASHTTLSLPSYYCLLTLLALLPNLLMSEASRCSCLSCTPDSHIQLPIQPGNFNFKTGPKQNLAPSLNNKTLSTPTPSQHPPYLKPISFSEHLYHEILLGLPSEHIQIATISYCLSATSKGAYFPPPNQPSSLYQTSQAIHPQHSSQSDFKM